MKICYEKKDFRAESLAVIATANKILEEYARQGYDLTLRQLYYQFVSRALIANKDTEYKRLGSIINDARLAGLIDWDHITDRTRNMRQNSHWDSPHSIIAACASQFRVDRWARQKQYVECFTPETQLNICGIPTSIASVAVGDKALTHQGVYRDVTKVIRNRYTGRLCEVKAAGLLPFSCTPSHPFWSMASDGHPKRKGYSGTGARRFNPPNWIKAAALRKSDMLQLPLLADLERRPAMGTVLELTGGSRSIPFRVEITELFLRVCGLYVAEGSIRGDDRTVQFTFNASETAYANLVTSWADQLGVGWSTAEGNGARTVYVYSRAIAAWFERNFGSGAFNKAVPTWLMHAAIDEQLLFLEYYFRGDGSFWDDSRSAIAATTRSHTLAQQVQLILLWAKVACTLDSVMDHGEPRWRMSIGGKAADDIAKRWGVKIPVKGIGRSRRYNHIQFRDGYACFPIRKIREYAYDGYVWNLEVEDHHSYCVPVAAHNCWVEKDALVGVLEVACVPLDVAYFSCRGYTSQSEMWSAAQRLFKKIQAGKDVTIIHLGDHDPSGIDMSRDIQDRITGFLEHHMLRDHIKNNPENALHAGEEAEDWLRRTGYRHAGERFTMNRIALNMAQIRQYDPPPNPAKLTDSRATGYIAEHGGESWELDALEPRTLTALIREHVEALRDEDLWDEATAEEDQHKADIQLVSENWDDVIRELQEKS